MKTVPGPSPWSPAPGPTRTILLVHGSAGSGGIWRRVEERLTDLPTAAVDMPGFGDCAVPPNYERDALADCVDRLDCSIDSTLDVPAVLCGNGVGSILCGHLGLRLRKHVRGIVMTGPVGLSGDGHANLSWLSHHRAGAAFLRLAGRSFGRAKFLRDQLADPHADPEAAAILLDALRRAHGFHHLARLNRPESLAGLDKIECAVTVLWGDRDGVLPVTRAAEFMTHLPLHARLEIVPGAGHALPLERPDLVAQAIVELA